MALYDPTTARVGDWISRPSVLPSLTFKPRTHHGIVVAVGRGGVQVFELNEVYRRIGYPEFAQAHPVTLVARAVEGQEQAVLDRMAKTMENGQQWSLFWTCEDVAAFVHDGVSKGKQGTEEILAATDIGYKIGKMLGGKY